MSTQKLNLNKKIIAIFSGHAQMCSTPKIYVKLTGSHSKAIVLNQIVYWSNKSNYNSEWFYKTYEEWYEEIGIGERTLRRIFDKLENEQWIYTKIKKIGGLNIKHFKPDIDKIIESLSTILHEDCPIRTISPVMNEDEQIVQFQIQKPCTNIAPAGQNDQLEPDNLSDSSIYTEEYLQKITTTASPNPPPTTENSSSSFSFNPITEKKLLTYKISADQRTPDEFLRECKMHIDNHNDSPYPPMQRCFALFRLLEQHKEHDALFLAKSNSLKPYINAAIKPFTDEEIALVQEYKHAVKMKEYGTPIETFIPSKEKRDEAIVLINRISEMETVKCQPQRIARAGSLNLASNLVSHLAL